MREGLERLKVLHVEEFLENRNHYQLIDVRSPGEFQEAHIPGAVNVPLFTNEQRAQVGITYKQEGTDQAKRVGLQLIAPRLPDIVDDVLAAAGDREIVIYCWRGGMRSHSMCALLNALKYPVYQLVGGYKAF